MSKKKKTNKNQTILALEEPDNLDKVGICMNCDHCIYIGEGDFICDAGEPFMVMSDWEPTDDYWNCAGCDYESDEEE